MVAYENKISPSGVGFDIACIAGGSRVTTADGYTLPVEAVTAEADLVCWDGCGVRPVQEHTGCISRLGSSPCCAWNWRTDGV